MIAEVPLADIISASVGTFQKFLAVYIKFSTKDLSGKFFQTQSGIFGIGYEFWFMPVDKSIHSDFNPPYWMIVSSIVSQESEN